MDITGYSDADLAQLKSRVEAEIRAREQFPDQLISEVVTEVQALHAREIDAMTVRCVLSANAQIAAK